MGPAEEQHPTTTCWWRPLGRSDRWALTWFLVIPVLAFTAPALFGHAAIAADNLLQNFPLRVMVGQQLASGHLPLLDPLANSGTPLLGGMNAGAFYPLTVIFAVVPALASWIINLVVVYLSAATGVFVLLRWHGLGTWPSFVAGFTYAYSGAMIGQIVHLGVVQGFSFLPWAIVVMLALAKRLRYENSDESWRRFALVGLPWSCAVALLWGLTFLTGEPRAIAEMELLTIIVVPSVLLIRTSYWLASWRSRVAYAGTLVAGFTWGVALGLCQSLPGWTFIHESQRRQISYGFFGAGSLSVRWSALLLSPDIFGGNGAFGQKGYFVNYNLAEVTGYVGLVALVGAAAFFTRCTRGGWRAAERDYVLYVVIAVVGLFATWGNFTPVGHIFRAIPLYNATRLQSRNVILVDLALAIVLGWWLNAVHERDPFCTRPGRVARWVIAAPVMAAAVLSIALLGWGPSVVSFLGVPPGSAHVAAHLKLTNALQLAIALGTLATLWWGRRSRRFFSTLVAIVVVDLTIFLTFTGGGLVGGSVPSEPSRSFASSVLGTSGRFALVDFNGDHLSTFERLGEPNLNVFTGLASVQGYGALESTYYDEATGTHPESMVNSCNLRRGVFAPLRLGTLVISSSQLVANSLVEKASSQTCFSRSYVPSTRRYFGEFLRVKSVTLRGVGRSAVARGALSIRLLGGTGVPLGPTMANSSPSPSRSSVTFTFHHAPLSAGFVVSSALGVRVADSFVTSVAAPHVRFSLDTNFEWALSSSSWRLISTHGTMSVFRATHMRAAAWLVSAPYPSRVTSTRSAPWGDAWVGVTLSSASTLDRSEAYLPSWRATARNDVTGRVIDLTVRRAGLIQSVRVPRGRWTVHFHYGASYVAISLIVSIFSAVALAGVGTSLGLRRRRKRRAKVLS